MRINSTALAAIALGGLILLIVAMILIGNRSTEDDRLRGDEASASRIDPSELCASRATYDEIKLELFRQAAAQRGSEQAAYDEIRSESTIRMEAPVLRDEDAGNGAVTCNGTVTLNLPASVEIPGGRRSLSADILYTVQPATNKGANVVSLANADEIVTPLASLVRTSEAPDGKLLPPGLNEIVPVEPIVEPGPDELPSARNPDTPNVSGSAGTAAVTPSFNCANARTSGEVAVCGDDRLATLDRRMAAQFGSALSRATPDQRALLIRTRDNFLGYRDQCTDNDCIAETYRGRMREIRDIMTGSWQPQR